MKSHNWRYLAGASLCCLMLMPAAWSQAQSQTAPDVSQTPIAADEPIAPSGFPPLPSTLELPITPTVSRSAESDFSNGRDGENPKLHEGYKHDPFMDTRGSSRTGHGATSAPTPRRPAAAPNRAPSYYEKPSDPGLVREWDLHNGPQPAPPQTVPVFQSQTQDLSQPQQDDFQSRHIPAQQNGAASHKTLEQRLYRGLRVLNGRMNPY